MRRKRTFEVGTGFNIPLLSYDVKGVMKGWPKKRAVIKGILPIALDRLLRSFRSLKGIFCSILQLVVEGVFDGDLVALREWAEAIDALEGMKCRDIKAWRAAFGFNARIQRNAVTVDIEDDGDAFALRGARIGLSDEPLFGNLAIDDVNVIGKTGAEGTVLNGDACGTIFELHRGLGYTDAGSLTSSGLGGLHRRGLDVFWRLRSYFFGSFNWFGLLGGDGEVFGRGRRLGLLLCLHRRGAGFLGSENAGVECALAWR